MPRRTRGSLALKLGLTLGAGHLGVSNPAVGVQGSLGDHTADGPNTPGTLDPKPQDQLSLAGRKGKRVPSLLDLLSRHTAKLFTRPDRTCLQ